MNTDRISYGGKNILVVGGDLRQLTLAKLFAKDNRVYCVGMEQSDLDEKLKSTVDELILVGFRPDCIIFPMPVSLDNCLVNTPFSNRQILVKDVLALCHNKTAVYGGKISPSIKQILEKQSIWYLDLLDREEMAVLNAVPTAEGALQIAMEEMATTIYKTKCLVIGFGRISKVLSAYLKALGAEVTVSARKYQDIAWIKISGYHAIHTNEIKSVISEQQIVFNTVPAKILNESVLKKVSEDCLLIDLASKPGGIDIEIANRLGLKTIWALSLPGKVAPISAGQIIYDTIQNIETERRSYNE